MRKTAPLPFQGQKRYWVKETVNYIQMYLEARPGEHTPASPLIVFDVFGGSGILSNAIKKAFGDTVDVHYFDWDNYTRRLALVEQTNAQIELFRRYFADKGYKKDEKVTAEDREVALWLMDSIQPDRNEWDTVTLSAVTLFSGNMHADVERYARDGAFYHRAPQGSYETAGYLEGVNSYQAIDYRDAIDIAPPGTLLILDPPYLYTDQGGYSKGAYFGLPETFDLLMQMKTAMALGSHFILYTSEKSGVHHVNRLGATNIPDFNDMYLRERVMPSGSGGKLFNEQVYISYLPRQEATE